MGRGTVVLAAVGLAYYLSPDDEAVKTAIHDIQWSREVYRNSPYAILSDLWVHTRAIQYGKDNGLDDRCVGRRGCTSRGNLSPIQTISVWYKVFITGPSGISRAPTRC